MYLGPAVLMQAYRWVIDSRDDYREERLNMLGGDMRLDECKQLGVCTKNCPKDLDPKEAIGKLQKMYEEYYFNKAKRFDSVCDYVNVNHIVESNLEGKKESQKKKDQLKNNYENKVYELKVKYGKIPKTENLKEEVKSYH